MTRERGKSSDKCAVTSRCSRGRITARPRNPPALTAVAKYGSFAAVAFIAAIAIEQFADRIPTAVDQRIARGSADIRLSRFDRQNESPVSRHRRRFRACGFCSMAAAIFAMSSRLAVAHGMPRVVLLPKKISAKLSAMTALKPYFWIACGACSREEPQPKFAPESRIVAPLKRGSFERMRLVGAVGVLAHVVEQKFAEAIERDAFHEARRNDAIGVDVVAGNVNAAAGDLR